jgi:hypothetical protein
MKYVTIEIILKIDIKYINSSNLSITTEMEEVRPPRIQTGWLLMHMCRL